jgi:predicted dehydrogenase
MNPPIKIAILGFGFMGKMHAGVYRRLQNAEVVAIVDPRGEEALAAQADLNCPVYPTFAEALGACSFDAVDICLPTDLHRVSALEAFAHGKHVFCEKPIALNRTDALAMVEAAKQADRQLMVGHCIRFWPEYGELKRVVESREHGRLVSLSMTRRTGRPGYSMENWVNQPERCLGAALDLHIHDSDFLVHLLGMPEAVYSRGIRDDTGWSSIVTQYLYRDTNVVAEGAWNYPETWGFQMQFTAVFENAVLEYDSRAETSLRLTRSGHLTEPVVLADSSDGYFHELAHFIHCIGNGEPVAISHGAQASRSLELVLAEIESAGTGRLITLTH